MASRNQHVGLALEVVDRAMVMYHGSIALDRAASEVEADPTLIEAAYFGRDLSSEVPDRLPDTEPRQ